MNTSGVYTITNTSSGKVYVGSSNNIERRWKEHRKLLNGNRHHSIALQRAWNKYGAELFSFEILEECDQEFILGAELFWINTLKSFSKRHGYNIASVPSSRFGIKHSEEAKHLMRLAAIGRTVSDETRGKLSQAGIGKTHSEKAKAKISASNLGRSFSANSRNKISESRGGVPFVAIRADTEQFAGAFNTLGDASKSLGADPSNIKKCLAGKLRKTAGYVFSYITTICPRDSTL